jgi:hypothetical protein
MSALDPAQLAARFRRVWTSTPAAANAALDGAPSQVGGPTGQAPAANAAPAPTEAPWLTAEAYGASVTGRDPADRAPAPD